MSLVPSSRARYGLRISAWDLGWTMLTPILALQLSSAYILSTDGLLLVIYYWTICVACCLVSIVFFRINHSIPSYFSVYDVTNVGRAVLISEFVICVLLFLFNRLEGIPRSAPLLHGLLEAVGLIGSRGVLRLFSSNSPLIGSPNKDVRPENVIMIGASRLTSRYIKFTRSYLRELSRVVAVLDDQETHFGRTISGVYISGPLRHLDLIVDEFAVHGIQIDRVLVDDKAPNIDDDAVQALQQACSVRNIEFDRLPRFFGNEENQPAQSSSASAQTLPVASLALPRYLKFKYLLDFVVALMLLFVLLPLILVAAALVWIDLGSPLLFWQQRIGVGNRTFLLYKFRTLRAPFDSTHQPVAEHQRLSTIGRLLRQTRLDELPQLLNVLVGEMSLVGPRPLLPRDQPADPTIRLLVRPGLTGWAQVNGGTLLTPEEKDTLDAWYVRNASLWFDLRIIFLTIRVVLSGERRGKAEGTVPFTSVDRSATPSREWG